jgi:hypothetical protein
VSGFVAGIELDNELDPTHRRTARMLPAIIANLMAFDRTMGFVSGSSIL